MGGYGALKLGLTHPERFAAVAALSGVADIHTLTGRLERAEIVQRVFDGEIGADDDLFELLKTVDPASAPSYYIACGTEEDRLMPGNQRLADEGRALGLEVTTDFRPGVHEWGLWDDVIQDVITWLPIDQ
jgi:putative tributyrin esterase